MRILVAVASRYGSTCEIAGRLAAVLRVQAGDAPIVVEVRRLDEIHGLQPYDAVILGSSVFMGKWVRRARDFVAANADVLARVPTWLFSCGPSDDTPTPGSECADGERIRDLIGARDHRVFAGRLAVDRSDRAVRRRRDRLLAAMAHGRSGDARTTARVDTWAVSIADQIRALRPMFAA